MSKLLSSVLDKVSENNNEYRSILRTLNSSIDERTTVLVGEIVTNSGYTADFSSTLTESKEKLVNPISRIIESYVIKDLRSVETVNEQFVEKINDKLENANINSKEEKDSFSENLNALLNNKYLEIVKIKRVDFLNENNSNDEIETTIEEFINYLKDSYSFEDEKLNDLFNNYKQELYDLVSKSLSKISDLYLNNFVSEVSSNLNSAIDFDENDIYSKPEEEFKPYIPEMTTVAEVEIQNEEADQEEVPGDSISVIPEIPVEPIIPEIPSIPEIDEESNSSDDKDTEEKEEEEVVTPIEIEPIAPIEIKEPSEVIKRSYDVDEILKIAKSPIVAMPEEKEQADDYINVEPIVSEVDSDTMESEFNEREVVEEMIGRLTRRLEAIDERRSRYEAEKAKLEEDEAFVNDLIESSRNKKEELDKFEQELNEKEQALDEKQKELDKKINDIMPFANAVLNSEKES